MFKESDFLNSAVTNRPTTDENEASTSQENKCEVSERNKATENPVFTKQKEVGFVK